MTVWPMLGLFGDRLSLLSDYSQKIINPADLK